MKKVIVLTLRSATVLTLVAAALPAQELPEAGGGGPGLLILACNADKSYVCGSSCGNSACHWCCATCP